MKQVRLVLAVLTLLFCLPSLAFAQDYEAELEASVTDYADEGEFSGQTINVACRRLAPMDYIQSQSELFESYTGLEINFTNYPENELRSQLVTDASNRAGGFDVYCLDGNYVPLFANNSWVRPIGADISEPYML